MLNLAEKTDIIFEGLGIHFKNVGDGFSIFGFRIAYYGVCIAIAMVCGYLVAEFQAKRTRQNPETYLNFAMLAVVISVICARLYYVAFSWDKFKDDPVSILNLRTGGLAIYGGVIGGVSTAVVYALRKRINVGKFCDTAVVGLLTGQIIGRWGNFFNREAFGSYTGGPFRMLLNIKDVWWQFDPASSEEALRAEYEGKTVALNRILEIRNNTVVRSGETYISVHPTFLYESFLNLCLLIIILLYTKKKKANGELFFMYVAGYGAIRFFVENMRSDQLLLWGTGLAVSQLLSMIMFAVGVGMIIYLRLKKPLNNEEKAELGMLKDEDLERAGKEALAKMEEIKAENSKNNGN